MVKACPNINYDLVFHRKEGQILSFNVPKISTVLNKNGFNWSKFKFQNGLKLRTYIYWTCWDKPLGYSQTPKKVCKYYCRIWTVYKNGNFGTWNSKWSMWNGGVTIFHTFFIVVGWQPGSCQKECTLQGLSVAILKINEVGGNCKTDI